VRVLIVGGGIAGAALAALLSRQGKLVTLVDRSDGDGGAGYVLGLWPLGSRVLRALGLYEDFEARSAPLRHFATAAPNGTVLNLFDPERIVSSLGEIRMVERAALVDLLQHAIGKVDRRSGTTVTDLVQDDHGVDVTLQDGSVERFDLVLCCDGANSGIRKLVFGEGAAQSTGWYGWGWWLDSADCAPDTMTEFWHPGRRFMAVYPAKGVACAFAGLPMAALPEEADRIDMSKVRARFADMGGVAASALEKLDASRTVFHDVFRTVTNEHWVKGRVVLVGDSASSYFPYGGLGLGASMALESVAVLADELSRASATHLPASLSFYERRRLDRIRDFEAAAARVVETMLHPTEIPKTEDLLERQRSHFKILRGLIQAPL